jgi:hypothetical protein
VLLVVPISEGGLPQDGYCIVDEGVRTRLRETLCSGNSLKGIDYRINRSRRWPCDVLVESG